MIFTSLMSGIADSLCTLLFEQLAQRLPDQSFHFDANATWAERQALANAAEAEIIWICGLLYTVKKTGGWPYSPFAAPCMTGESGPVYYGDTIVRSDSSFDSFESLRGRTWAYNETSSFSGYDSVRAWMAAHEVAQPFFGRMVASGAHLNSVAMVRGGEVDCATIDSTILDMMRVQGSTELDDLRVVARIGPYPMPVWVLRNDCSAQVCEQLTQTLCTLHQQPEVQELLHRWAVARFAPVEDADYDPMRRAAERAATVQL